MNYHLADIPERSVKPRDNGITMAMDKGLSLRQAEDFVEVAGHLTDIVKLGFGTSFVTPKLREKLELYKKNNIITYFGGTLFEAFIIRGKFDDYVAILKDYGVEYVEVSDGSITLDHKRKCDLISTLAKDFTVLSEVGSKDENKIIPPYQWIELMQAEIDAGAWKVIGEARESGNVGLFRSSGEVRSGLVQEILTKIPEEKIVWEAPLKGQQVYFLKLIGPNVNLGNIAPNEVIPLETLRVGLRGDTFHDFLSH